MDQVVETADEFFARVRTRAELDALEVELPENRLALLTREALAGKFDRRRREGQAARRKARAEVEAPRTRMSAEMRALLPPPRLGPRKPAVHARWAARFWDRVAHVDVSGEARGYELFKTRERMKAAAVVFARFNSGPLDPITAEEYAAVTRRDPRTARARRERERERRAIARGKIIAPAGMTLERAEAIARLALGMAEDADETE